jgi:hypothetical protein
MVIQLEIVRGPLWAEPRGMSEAGVSGDQEAGVRLIGDILPLVLSKYGLDQMVGTACVEAADCLEMATAQ